ncbi:biotin/lipoyl-binding protein [Chloroflexota bacterium]
MALIIFILGGLVILVAGCNSTSDEAETAAEQTVTVQRGNLVAEITAAGNLALSRTEELTFELVGTVADVSVEEGDTVTVGHVLAKLDTSEWEDHLEVLEEQLTAAERQLTIKERAVTTAERNLAAKKRAVTARGNDQLQAEINLQTAQRALDVMADVQEARDAVEELEYELIVARMRLQETTLSPTGGDASYWLNQISLTQTRLTQANAELAEVLADPDNSGVTITEISLKQLQLELTQSNLVAAGEAVKIAGEDVVEAEKDIEDAEVAVSDAQKDVKDAQEALGEMRGTNLEIIAPFDGFVTRVNVEGGDEVMKGTVAVQVADPNKFEANILVSEMDILQVMLGAVAWVEVDAMQGMSLSATVTNIAPTATIQSGVVNYQVKVEIQSLEATWQERQEARQDMAGEIMEGQLPERLQQAIDEGIISQEQVEEMMKRIKAGELPQLPSGEIPGGMSGERGQLSMVTIPEDFQMREGLTVTVSIIVAERNDVLLVPNAAITQKGIQSYVRVVLPSGAIEQRAVQTGISDWQFTEVTEGLTEGDQVLISQNTTTSSETSSQKPSGIGLFGRSEH